MENLNAEQVKEDIDNCLIGECELCSYYDQTACKEHLMHNVLALITSQEHRIKELGEENERLSLAIEMDGFSIRNRLEGIDRYCNEKIKIGKADTVRKMHSEIKDRCIKGGIYPAFVARTIDTITKEMLEGEE